MRLTYLGPSVAAAITLIAGEARATPCGGVQDYVYVGTRLLAVASTPLPTLGLSTATSSVVEQPEAFASVTVVLTTSDGCPLTAAASVAYSTQDGDARAGVDYVAASGTIAFDPKTRSGATASISVALFNDTVPEPNRTFSIVVSAPSGASVGTSAHVVTILDNDTPIVSFASAASRVGENGSWATARPSVRVATNEGNNLVAALTVNYAAVDGTAVAGSDYVSPPGTLTLRSGTQSGSTAEIDVGVIQDALIEPDETFSLALLATAGAILGAPAQHTVTVISDDVVSVSGTMVASGDFAVGGTVTYTVVLTNTGPGGQTNNPGDEFVDQLPAALTLLPPNTPGGSTATAGALTANGNTLFWNGALASGGTVTLTIRATVNAGAQSQLVSNQGAIRFDSNASGDNDAPAVTDDPRVAGASDPTVFLVGSGPISYYTLAPCRVVDTRNPDGPRGGPALVAGSDRTFALAGVCGIPTSAKGLAVNISVTGATATGNLGLRPAGTPRGQVSAINYGAGQTRGNNGIAVLNPSQQLAVACNQASGTVHFILDVSGYFE